MVHCDFWDKMGTYRHSVLRLQEQNANVETWCTATSGARCQGTDLVHSDVWSKMPRYRLSALRRLEQIANAQTWCSSTFMSKLQGHRYTAQRFPGQNTNVQTRVVCQWAALKSSLFLFFPAPSPPPFFFFWGGVAAAAFGDIGTESRKLGKWHLGVLLSTTSKGERGQGGLGDTERERANELKNSGRFLLVFGFFASRLVLSCPRNAGGNKLFTIFLSLS